MGMRAKRDVVVGLGAKLKASRLAKGLTLLQVEEATGIHQPTLSEYESDKTTPTVAVLRRLAEMYGVTMNDLVP